MRFVAAEQCCRVGRAVPEFEIRQPPMAGFLTEHAQRVVLAEKRLRRVLRIAREPIHVDHAPQAAAAAEVAARIEHVHADAADLVRHRELERERAALGRSGVREEHDLIEVVVVRLIELPRHRHEVEVGLG